MPALTLATLTMLAPRGRDDYLAHLAGPGKAELDKAGILQSKLRLCHFLAQIAHESGGFTVKEESLNYKTSKRLMQVWPKRFPTVASTKPFLGQPTKLGDKVYGGRMGNKDPGDGFKYRGRGYLQTTGRDAYKRFATSSTRTSRTTRVWSLSRRSRSVAPSPNGPRARSTNRPTPTTFEP